MSFKLCNLYSSGENSIIIVPGANLLLQGDDILAVEDLIRSSKVVVCQLEVGLSATLETLKLAKKHNGRDINIFCRMLIVHVPA